MPYRSVAVYVWLFHRGCVTLPVTFCLVRFAFYRHNYTHYVLPLQRCRHTHLRLPLRLLHYGCGLPIRTFLPVLWFAVGLRLQFCVYLRLRSGFGSHGSCHLFTTFSHIGFYRLLIVVLPHCRVPFTLRILGSPLPAFLPTVTFPFTFYGCHSTAPRTLCVYTTYIPTCVHAHHGSVPHVGCRIPSSTCVMSLRLPLPTVPATRSGFCRSAVRYAFGYVYTFCAHTHFTAFTHTTTPVYITRWLRLPRLPFCVTHIGYRLLVPVTAVYRVHALRYGLRLVTTGYGLHHVLRLLHRFGWLLVTTRTFGFYTPTYLPRYGSGYGYILFGCLLPLYRTTVVDSRFFACGLRFFYAFTVHRRTGLRYAPYTAFCTFTAPH